jgi:hypothetical protein
LEATASPMETARTTFVPPGFAKKKAKRPVSGETSRLTHRSPAVLGTPWVGRTFRAPDRMWHFHRRPVPVNGYLARGQPPRADAPSYAPPCGRSLGRAVENVLRRVFFTTDSSVSPVGGQKGPYGSRAWVVKFLLCPRRIMAEMALFVLPSKATTAFCEPCFSTRATSSL